MRWATWAWSQSVCGAAMRCQRKTAARSYVGGVALWLKMATQKNVHASGQRGYRRPV
jgi:hypothetical protein